LRQVYAGSPYSLRIQPQNVHMKSVNELLVLFMRQAQLERATKQRGGARVVEEQDLHVVRRKFAAYPKAATGDAVVKDDDRV
jgi:hypothetical protein